jgi:uncharacterized membrane protein YedE/YeeE
MNAANHKTGRPVLSLLVAGALGALFGAGLLVSGMTQPAKVIAFLDPISGWDPSLAFVMGGAVLTYAIAFRVIRSRRADPFFDLAFHLPTRRDLDPPLIAGAALFGVGWGLGGLCPGPAVVSAASGSTVGLTFVAAMLAGMYLQHRTTK